MKTIKHSIFLLFFAALYTAGCASQCGEKKEAEPEKKAPPDEPGVDDDETDETDETDLPEKVVEISSVETDDPTRPDEPLIGKGRTPDVHFVPTPKPVVEKMLRVAKVTKNDLVYDLGCGDGRIVIMAAEKFGARAVGFDIDPKMVAKARANVIAAGVQHLVTIKEADIFELDLTPANVITMYLLPRLNVKLIPQLEKLKKGTRIVSHDFSMEGVQHDELHVVADEEDDVNRDHHIYFWTIPLKIIDENSQD